jgi:filamentous hemagglutinin
MIKIRQIDGIRDLHPRSTLEGNEYFLGPGEHLPGGGPEMVINSVPTSDSKGVKP